MNTYLIVSNCSIVNGKDYSIIYDFFRSNYDYIPNDLYEILADKQTINFAELELKNTHNIEIIKEYKDFLIEKEYILKIDEDDIDFFPKIRQQWDWPGHIQSIIIQLNDKFDYTKILNILDELGCRFIQIRIDNSNTFQNIIAFFNLCISYRFKSLEIVIDSLNTKINDLINFLDNLDRRIHLYMEYSSEYSVELICDGKILCTKLLTDIDNFRKTNPKYFFSLDIDLFNESQIYNPYYNRKIFISRDNIIKNSFFNEINFLNLNKTEYSKKTILELIKESEFNWLWHVSKNQITECQQCAYRNMCTDLRIPLKKNNEVNFYHQEICKVWE